MATLYTTDTGFRFPYPKWNRTSTPKNLLFLEALLEKYLHVHETVSSTLYVTPSGYRMPYKKSPDNLEENMKFVERQLEHALHEHEVATTDEEATEEQLTDGSLEAMSTLESTSGGTFQEVMKNSTFGRASLSTANPRTGSNHVRIDMSELSANIYFGPSEIADGGQTFPYTPASEGDEITVSVYVYEDSGFADATLRLRATGIEIVGGSVNDFTGFYDESFANGTDAYEEHTDTITVPGSGTLGFDPDGVYFFVTATTPSGDRIVVDLDDFSIITSVTTTSALTLFTNHKGFRFPYNWETEQQRRMNFDHLETMITKFLHKHEVVV